MKRDGIDADRAAEKVKAQMPLKRKQKLADIVIDNSGTPAQTQQKVSKSSQIWQQNLPNAGPCT